MNSIDKAISTISSSVIDGDSEFTETIETVVKFAEERSAEPTASEFLQKAKAICDNRGQYCNSDNGTEKCPLNPLCWERMECLDEADLVRKVMEYRLEDGDAERN